ncbi:MAG: hypothetical protein H6719_07425 [Sandaracinaceae bacterium]|nr:hypothetical protein [Sandaracinaceae bacterium]
MRRLWWLGALALVGCGSADPYCGLPADATGRLIAYCGSPREEPVCNEPGQEAHYEMGATGLVLVGGQRASCGIDDEIVCPVGTVGEAFCITDPEL